MRKWTVYIILVDGVRTLILRNTSTVRVGRSCIDQQHRCRSISTGLLISINQERRHIVLSKFGTAGSPLMRDPAIRESGIQGASSFCAPFLPTIDCKGPVPTLMRDAGIYNPERNIDRVP